MLPKIDPVQTTAWKMLQQHYEEMNNVHIKDLFRKDQDRFSKYSLSLGDTVFDYSKNLINEKTLSLFLQLAEECKLKQSIEAMFGGDKINETENRSVLHVALRNFSKQPFYSEGNDVMPLVKRVKRQMKNFCEKIHSGEWRG